jgi:hypothetical protein
MILHAMILEESFMATKPSLTSIGQLVPELPVIDVERAQQHYRDALGFEIGWHDPDGIGAVSRGNVAIFFARKLRHLLLRFTGSSPRISMRRTTSCNLRARILSSRWKRNPGA